MLYCGIDWNHKGIGEQNLCSPNLHSYIVLLWQRDFGDAIEVSDDLKLADYPGLLV